MRDRIDNILGVIDEAAKRRITVFGDFCLDKYLYINPERNEPSKETGLIAYQAERKSLYPGVGGTVTNNLCALGAHVHCVGLVGDDGEGYELIKGLEQIGAQTGSMVISDKVMTSSYIKPMVGSASEPYAEINRIDIRNFSETPGELEEMLLTNLEQAVRDSEGLVVTDQFLELNYSVVTERIRRELADIARRYPEKFFFVDSRGFVDKYCGLTVKCNQFELPGIGQSKQLNEDYGQEKDWIASCARNDGDAGREVGPLSYLHWDAGVGRDGGGVDREAILEGGKRLLAVNGCSVVVTAGADGAYVFDGKSEEHIPAFRVSGPIDIVGAGDATNAGTILGLTLGLSLQDAVLLGMCVSSITIQQIGVTGTATIEQVKQQLNSALMI